MTIAAPNETVSNTKQRLSESNKKIIIMMVSRLTEIAKELDEDVSVFNKKNFVKAAFIDSIVADSNFKKPAVTRMFYSHINKKTNAELRELSRYYRGNGERKEEKSPDGVLNTYGKMSEASSLESEISKSKKQPVTIYEKNIEKETEDVVTEKVFCGRNILQVHYCDGDTYFVLSDLLEALPISKNHKKMNIAFSIKHQTNVKIGSQNVTCIATREVASFLQKFVKGLPDNSRVKNELRFFIEDIYKLPAAKERESKKDLLAAKDEEAVNTPTKVHTAIIVNSEPVKPVLLDSKKVNQNDSVTNSSPYEESEEIRRLVRLLSDKIGYVSESARLQLVEIARSKGFVQATLATLKIIDGIDDVSEHFVKMIGAKANERL